MRRLNRLLQAARMAAGCQGIVITGFIEYSPVKHMFTAGANALNKAKGIALQSHYSEHETAAEAALRSFADGFPEAECTILIDDLTFPEVIGS